MSISDYQVIVSRRRGTVTGGVFGIVGLLLGSLPAVTAPTKAAQDRLEERRIAVAEVFEVGAAAYVRALALDQRRRSLWVGTSVGALEVDLGSHRIKNTFTRKNGLANEYVFAIGVDPDGPVWFGTNGGGTGTFADGVWKTRFPMHGLADYWVYAFEFAAGGDVWIGTWNGVNIFDPATQSFTTYRDELINIWVYGIGIDDAGRVWLGTEGGVSMFDNGTWRSWTHKDGLGAPNIEQLPTSLNTGLGTRSRHDLGVTRASRDTYNPDYVFAVQPDARGGVWFGTWGGGASYFDGERSWKNYTRKDGLAGDIVYSIAQEADGTLWFGTNAGVSRFDGRTWTSYGRRDGLIADHIYAIAVEPAGVIWLGSRGGVTRLVYKD